MSLTSLDNRNVMVIPASPTRAERIRLGIEVMHPRRDPLMVIGHGSSGTSICAGLIRKYCGVAFGNESQFMIRFARHAAHFGDLNKAVNLDRLVSDLLRERYFKRSAEKYGFRPTREQIIARTREKTCSGVFRAVFELMAEHQQTDRWGDKTPEYSLHLPELGCLFPDAQWIYTIRDGRDVALSVMSRYFGASNLIMAALEWRHLAELARQFLEGKPSESRMTVRYEDMMHDPVATLRNVMDFLQASPRDPEMFMRIGPTVRGELKSGTTCKWKSELTPRQREIFEAIAGDQLRAHGYETEFDRPRPESRMEMALAPWDDRLKHWTSPAVWRDSIYRGSIRLNDIGIRLRESLRRK